MNAKPSFIRLNGAKSLFGGGYAQRAAASANEGAHLGPLEMAGGEAQPSGGVALAKCRLRAKRGISMPAVAAAVNVWRANQLSLNETESY